MELQAATSVELGQLRARYLEAQLAGDLARALRVLLSEGVGRGVAIPVLQRSVLREAQREIGRLWQENRISVAQEHMATAISKTVLSYLYEAARRAPSNGKRVLVSCVEGELHDFPARLVADGLDLAGFEVRFLGADVPTQHLVSRVASDPPDLVALSATMSFTLPALQDAVQQLRAQAGIRMPIMIGGAACSASLLSTHKLNADATASEIAEVISIAKRLLGLEL